MNLEEYKGVYVFAQQVDNIVNSIGRVIRSWLCFCSLPGTGFSGKSPMSSCVQSAVSPVWILADTRGPRSRPMAVAPTRTISGLYF